MNCQALNQTKADLISVDYLTNSNLKILSLCETWGKSDSINSIKFGGFNLVSYFCRALYKGGGIGIWCREDVLATPLNLPIDCIEKDFEICGVKLKPKISSKAFIILTLYRAPSGNFVNFCECLVRVLDSVYDSFCEIILNGDFNIDPNRDRANYIVLSDVLSSYGLSNNIMEATRSCYTLDHVYSKFKMHCAVLDNHISDHRTILSQCNMFSSVDIKKHDFMKRSFSDSSIDSFLQDLEREGWQSVFEAGDVDTAFNNFHDTFSFYFNLSFPLKRYKKSNAKSWVNHQVKLSSDALRDMYRLSREMPVFQPDYVLAKNRHKSLVSSTKKAFYQARIQNAENPIRESWKVVRDLTSEKGSNEGCTQVFNDDVLENDPQVIANVFNNFFKDAPLKVVKSMDAQDVPLSVKPLPNSIFLAPFVERELVSLVNNKIKNKSSYGFDGVSGVLIRRVIHPLAKVLTCLVNHSFLQGHFPNILKLNKIIPIFKKGDTKDVGNYRPVALLSVFSKLFEYCFLSRLESFLDGNKVLSKFQFGFRKNRSTINAIYHFHQKLIECMEKGEYPVGIFCDLSRAFDCVNLTRLLTKMETYGVRGPALSWLSGYLRNRKQYVSIAQSGREHVSDRLDIDMGVPQGSVLGPVLFICYINDVVSVLSSDWAVSLYADDSAFIASSSNEPDLELSCNSGLTLLEKWFTGNSLHLNGSKTTYLRFHNSRYRRNIDMDIKIDNSGISRASSTRFLGLILDHHLDWKEHCESLCAKLSRFGYLLRSLGSVLSDRELLTVYSAYVASRLHYGILLWGSSVGTKAVFAVQKRILRCMLGVPQRISCRGKFRHLGILTVTGIFLYETSKFMFLNKQNIEKVGDRHDYPTRFGNSLRAPLCRLNLTKKSPGSLGVCVFNKLPLHIRESRNFGAFKNCLKQFLIEKEFYSTEEFFCDT